MFNKPITTNGFVELFFQSVLFAVIYTNERYYGKNKPAQN